jgi:hypothetical protein
MHGLPVFSSRSSGVLHSSTLVLATFGGKFAHDRSSLIVLQNVLRSWADPTRSVGLGPLWAGSGPFFSQWFILTFCTWPPSFVSFLGRHPRDQDRGIFMHELPVFSSRSSGVLHSSTLVLATFGGKFAHGRSSLIVLQNVLQTSCIFPH